MIEALSAIGDRPPCRVVVVGISGSGKTTLAREIAALRGLRHVELDALFWEPGWTPATTERFRARVLAELARHPGWVVDGNYSRARDLIWLQADTIVWLDYSLSRTLWRLWWRSWRRVVRRTELWNGNRETFRSQFLAPDGLLRDVWRNHRGRRARFAQLLADPAYAHAAWVRCRTPAATRRWLRSLAAAPGDDGGPSALAAGRRR